MFKGSIPALVTPFTSQGRVDEKAYQELVAWTIAEGVSAIVPCGTTGESPTLTHDEHHRVVELAVEAAAGKVPVIAGTGSNSTAEAVELTRHAKQAGASAALVVTPYYNKPTPDGLVAHFAAVAEAAPGLPLIAYNVPGRTGLNLTPAALLRLWENPQVVAVKESSGNLAQIAEIARQLPKGKLLLSGDDNLALASMAVGAAGLVSVLGNVLPRETAILVAAARRGNATEALRLHQQLLPLMDALFLESNPIPLKAALNLLGLCGDGLRLPLIPASAATRTRLAEALCLSTEGTLPGVN